MITWLLQAESPGQLSLDEVTVVNVGNGEVTQGPKLPTPSQGGCAVYDSLTGYVYYLAGQVAGGTPGVFRRQGECRLWWAVGLGCK